MADSFFGFDTSSSNLNDDEGGGDGSEEEYDALNDETFGTGTDELDWEVEHEHLAYQLESSRRHDTIDDLCNSQLEASLSQLVAEEAETPRRSLGSSVWRHDPAQLPAPQPLKNVCTVEELERQLRQKQQNYNNQNFFQPRFPVILQRPPGLQGPVPLPFAPPQSMNQMNQSLNKIMTQNPQINQMGQTNQMMPNHVNQMGQNMNQLGQNMNQMTPNVNQFMQYSQVDQFQNNHGPNNMMMSQNMHQPNQMMSNQMGIPNVNQIVQNINQMPQNSHMNQMGPNLNQIINQPNPNKIVQNTNQMPPNPMGQNVNPMGQNHSMPNGNQFGQMNQFHMMGQNRMMVPPPGMNMPRQNFNPNMGPFNPNYRGPPISKPNEQPNMMMEKQIIFQNQQMNQLPQNNHLNQNNQLGQNVNQLGQNMNQMGQNMNQMGQNMNQMGQNMNQMGQNINQMGQNVNQMGQNMNQMGQTINQTGQNLQNLNLSPNKMKTEKKQQTRIYNNSKGQNITSQNLVQLIQNTHPMLQFNSGLHNATHHPLLHRTQFGNVSHPIMNQNQRTNGSFGANSGTCGTMSIANGSDVDCESDEYAGLMTAREKQWLVNIQMLQLNTGTPYIHDFYYTVFLERQAKKEKEGIKEAHKANQQNHPFYSGAKPEARRSRHNSTRHNSGGEDYVPAQFENSLGKLQCGSVTAPRKIIDLEVVGAEAPPPGRSSRAPSVASSTYTEVPREMKRTKQLLLDIESLYLILLRIEELNDPLAISNALILKEREEKQKQLEALQKELENDQEDESNVFLKNIESVQRRPKQDSPKSETIDKRQVVNLAVAQKPGPVKNLLDEDKDELVNKMFAGLLTAERLLHMLAVRKGRSLVCRFISRTSPSHPRMRAVWSRILRAITSMRRHTDTLATLANAYTRYIEASSGWGAILESCALLSEGLDPARTPYILTTPFTLTCVCALIEKASTLIHSADATATANERQWSKFLKTLARALKNTTLNIGRPMEPLSESRLTQHLRQLDSRSTIEILQRGKPAEFDLTKTDIHDQLVKYLCL